MTEPNLGEVITTTLRNRRKKIYDNMSNSNALLHRLQSKGKRRVIKGGRTIVCNLEYGEADFQRYSGYDTLSIQAAQVHDAAEFDPVHAAVPVAISGRERRINRGKEQIISLIKGKVGNAERSMRNNISNDVYSDGTADNQMNGLQALVADDPTTGTVGGINAATYTWWQNNMVDVSSEIGTVDAANVLYGMNKLWLECLRGNDKPDLIVADSIFYDWYERNLQLLQRYTDTKSAEAGFDSLKYKSADVIYDGDSGIGASRMYFLNTDYLEMVAYEGADFEPTDEKMSVNQDADVRHLLYMGNMTISNRSLQGLLKA